MNIRKIIRKLKCFAGIHRVTTGEEYPEVKCIDCGKTGKYQHIDGIWWN